MTARTVLRDWRLIARRNLLHAGRTPAWTVVAITEPVALVLLFRYVLGGAMVATGESPLTYQMPGLIGEAAFLGSMLGGIALAGDVSAGLVDRLRTMPIGRSALLGGRLATDAVQNTLAVLVTIGVAYLTGFRFETGAGESLGCVVLAVGFGMAITCISVFLGLTLRRPRVVLAVGAIVVGLFVVLSTALVPAGDLPGWLQPLAGANPFSTVVESLRASALGGPIGTHLALALVWSAAIAAVFWSLSSAAFRKGA